VMLENGYMFLNGVEDREIGFCECSVIGFCECSVLGERLGVSLRSRKVYIRWIVVAHLLIRVWSLR
jgi:hypothetical protein